jgi:DNA-binding SARP family transcriptional activator
VLTVRLVGPPALERDGRPVASPRGRKAWVLLAYVLLAERPVSRQQLAELIFPEADDPLGALRWSLSELRRALGERAALTGDPVSPALDATVDLDGPGELLEGVHLPDCPELETWLVVSRHRVSARAEAADRERAVRLIASGQAADAVPLAQRVVARNPLDEGNHALLVRALALAGDRSAALKQADVAADLIRRELGATVSPAVRQAADVAPGETTGRPRGGRAAALAQLDAGKAAIVAGAVDAGLQCLRRAVVEADRDPALQGRCLAALGSALTHAVRGADEEGAVALHEALELAGRAGDRETALFAQRELGFIEVQAGRRETAARWLAGARSLATTDAERSGILGLEGMNASDRGDYPTAFAALHASVESAARAGDGRQQAWSASLLGRAHVLRGEQAQAAAAVAESLDLVRREHWLAFQPWPQAFEAELALLGGDLTGATEQFEVTWALANQIDDPCWQGVCARGLGLVHATRGDHRQARHWLAEAVRHGDRVSDRYQWVTGYVLDAVATAALDRGDEPAARAAVGRLTALAARCDLGELQVRGLLHSAHLGDAAAAGAARTLASGIDNPALAGLLRG